MVRKRKLLTSNGPGSGTEPNRERYDFRPRNSQQVKAGVKKEEPEDLTDEPTPRWDCLTPKGNSSKPVIHVIKKEEPDEEEEQMTSERFGRRRNHQADNPSNAPPAKKPAHKLVHEVKEEVPEEETEQTTRPLFKRPLNLQTAQTTPGQLQEAQPEQLDINSTVQIVDRQDDREVAEEFLLEIVQEKETQKETKKVFPTQSPLDEGCTAAQNTSLESEDRQEVEQSLHVSKINEELERNTGGFVPSQEQEIEQQKNQDENAEKEIKAEERDGQPGSITLQREIHQEEDVGQETYEDGIMFLNPCAHDSLVAFVENNDLFHGTLKISRMDMEKLQVLSGEDISKIHAWLDYYMKWSVAKNGYEAKTCRELRAGLHWHVWSRSLVELAGKNIHFNQLETEKERKYKTILDNWYRKNLEVSGNLTRHQMDMFKHEVEMTEQEIDTWWAKTRIERFGANEYLESVYKKVEEGAHQAILEVGIDTNLIKRWILDYYVLSNWKRNGLRLPHSEEQKRILSEMLQGKITEKDVQSGNVPTNVDVKQLWKYHSDEPINTAMLINSGILTAAELDTLQKLYQKHPDSLQDFLMNSLDWNLSTYMLVKVYEILRESE